ncbi:citrate (Si)-synthase [bacterium]|nr:citrate (Si)-synthase [bacterium]
MGLLQKKLSENLSVLRKEINDLIEKHGDRVISNVTVKQALGGMRGVESLICDTSIVEPDKGLIIRDSPILDLVDRLPEELFYLLLTGDLPDKEALLDLQRELRSREEVPSYVWSVLDALSGDAHPMTMLSTAILVMHRDSVFAMEYRKGIPKSDYWIYVLEDALRLVARIPAIAAYIYRKRFNRGERIHSDPEKTWADNFAFMMGIHDPQGTFADLIRLYMVLHIDHEGGNVSAHTCHCVGSALSDPFYSISAAMNGLSGPLHGLANQECLRFVLSILKKFGGVPTESQIVDFAWETLNSGKVIPGYGHAVLRVTDPRFIAFRNFGLRACPNDDVFKIVNLLYKTIPDILKEHGRAKNPWPNVDAGSGALLYHYGIREFEYYTVLFGASRAMGLLAQLVLSRGLMEPIERPKSVRTVWIKEIVATGNKNS